MVLSPIQYLGMPEPWSKLEFWQVCEIKPTSRGKELNRSHDNRSKFEFEKKLGF
jgi:hypothetical protein